MAAIVLATVTTVVVISNGGTATDKAGQTAIGTGIIDTAKNVQSKVLDATLEKPSATLNTLSNEGEAEINEDVAQVLPGQYQATDEEITMLAKLIWGEARGVQSVTQRAAVIWCVLNRVDASEFPDTIAEVVLQKKQFVGYAESFPATDENVEIVEDVISRWNAEKVCTAESGRVLPSDYKWFTGDGQSNYFTNGWPSGDTWDWSMDSPYAS